MANEWKRFDMLWDDSEKEIFRLQLLNAYRVKSEEEQFRRYKQGLSIEIDANLQKWLDRLKKKTDEEVRNINMQVVDLPLTDYLKFEISSYPLQERFGRETFLAERSNVRELISGFQDYWMFDSKYVMLMNYDSEGRFLDASFPALGPAELARYVSLKKELIEASEEMYEFFRMKGLDFPESLFL